MNSRAQVRTTLANVNRCPASAGSSRQRILYLAPDCTDSAVKKRAHGFLGLGHELLSFSFRRERYAVDYEPDWPNVELGRSTERRLAHRVFLCLDALRRIRRHRSAWRRATIIYARNLDLALLGWLARVVTRCRAPLVYEVLDIHPVLLSSGLKGRFARWLERRILRRCRLLVISSPAFAECYFEKRQGYTGPTFLLENKWPREGIFAERMCVSLPYDADSPVWTIGWFGNLRCERSLRLLVDLADALPNRVRISLRGCASYMGEERLRASIAGRTNIEFGGEYVAPDDLPDLYRQIHWNWCADFSGGENGRWLIPNRIYEGGFFGVPALAVAGHYTGRLVQERRLGVALGTPPSSGLSSWEPSHSELLDALVRLLTGTTPAEYRQLRRTIEEQPIDAFVDTGDLDRMIRDIAS